ncbi:MFS transporter [Streptomyces rubellomurinus]|uniref:MFS transporter n=1 Tax=Streptomyces sp. Y1 TaxID=3238634 RepID=A0AB39TT99_9ACTN|nr:MFS transporter [Streptomyces rubellomurinus]
MSGDGAGEKPSPAARVLRAVTGGVPAPGPARRLALGQLVDSVGFGINLLTLPFFLARVVELPAAQVGLVLSVGGAVGVWAGVPVGHVADRLGLRRVLVCAYLLHVVVAAVTPFARSFGTAAAVVGLTSFCFEGSRAVRHAVIARTAGPQRATFRAQLRSITNIGVALGSVLAGVATQVDSTLAFSLALWGKALCLLLVAVIQSTLPAYEALPPAAPAEGTGETPRRSVALKDAPYLTVTALNAVLFMSGQVLTLGIPLWIASRHAAPGWMSAALLLANTVIVVVFQVRMTRGIDSPAAAGRAWVRSGLALLLTCAALAATDSVPVAVSVPLFFLALLVFTAAEMWHSAGSFELALGLAPPHAAAQYQGVFNLGEGIATALGPAAIAGCVTVGGPGWIGLGLVFAACGLLAPAATDWARRTRHPDPALPEPGASPDQVSA